jgi:hypothetical protein
MITGCIQNAPSQAGAAGTASGTAGTATSSARNESKYVLANAKAASGTTGSAVGTTGSTPTATRYRLEGDDKTISPHVNHQVEITGTVENNASSATSGATSSTGESRATAAAAGPMLKVTSLRMISATCPQQ